MLVGRASEAQDAEAHEEISHDGEARIGLADEFPGVHGRPPPEKEGEDEERPPHVLFAQGKSSLDRFRCPELPGGLHHFADGAAERAVRHHAGVLARSARDHDIDIVDGRHPGQEDLRLLLTEDLPAGVGADASTDASAGAGAAGRPDDVHAVPPVPDGG